MWCAEARVHSGIGVPESSCARSSLFCQRADRFESAIGSAEDACWPGWPPNRRCVTGLRPHLGAFLSSPDRNEVLSCGRYPQKDYPDIILGSPT